VWSTSTIETYKRAGFACNCLLGVEMTLSTAAFGSVSLLASGLVGRLILAARQVLLRRLDEEIRQFSRSGKLLKLMP
jgi:hypothetical protein